MLAWSAPEAVLRSVSKIGSMADEENADAHWPEPIVSTADLARRLNISQWAVSRAINGHKGVSEKTRQAVFDAMKESGFRPNPLARGLRGRGSRMIGVAVNRLVAITDQMVMRLQAYLVPAATGACWKRRLAKRSGRWGASKTLRG